MSERSEAPIPAARIVFAPEDRAQALALTIATVRPALDERTAAVILVHIGGLVTAEAEALAQLCRNSGVPLVEDAAHAHGAAWRGTPAGSFGTAAAFSFYPTKVMTT